MFVESGMFVGSRVGATPTSDEPMKAIAARVAQQFVSATKAVDCKQKEYNQQMLEINSQLETLAALEKNQANKILAPFFFDTHFRRLDLLLFQLQDLKSSQPEVAHAYSIQQDKIIQLYTKTGDVLKQCNKAIKTVGDYEAESARTSHRPDTHKAYEKMLKETKALNRSIQDLERAAMSVGLGHKLFPYTVALLVTLIVGASLAVFGFILGGIPGAALGAGIGIVAGLASWYVLNSSMQHGLQVSAQKRRISAKKAEKAEVEGYCQNPLSPQEIEQMAQRFLGATPQTPADQRGLDKPVDTKSALEQAREITFRLTQDVELRFFKKVKSFPRLNKKGGCPRFSFNK